MHPEVVPRTGPTPANFELCVGRDRRSRYKPLLPTSRNFPPIHGTTVMCVRRKNKVVIAADGQVTRGERVMKQMARSRSGCVKRAAAPCGELITLL